ncbi:uncharacterized protein [Fopius arisanus]|uniref:Uncharacterized protein n=1 Tax=Fopius arisanus TaxID=64838 RepID=A0A9R1SWT4_9HYME|nr:PREDICTED: uncharacterized protein LOC105263828 [Fopius arisanus]
MKYFLILLLAVLEVVANGPWNVSLRCPSVSLKNGRVQIRKRGKTIRFKCLEGFTLVGDRYSYCIQGKWDTALPICVNAGCPKLPSPNHAFVANKYNGAILIYFCEPGYILVGSSEIYCNGKQWNGTAPFCRDTTLTAPTKCDFETPDLCWWTQDPKHDFDWTRHNFQTPSWHIGTGPTHDHTLGPGNDGYYLYIEASGRLINDTARIMSPLYNASLTDSGCFSFWYHMYGATIGTLRIYIKFESNPDNPQVMFERNRNQGNHWLHGIFNLPKSHDNFQIIIEGVRGTSYVSDLAIDDIAILQGEECLNAEKTTDEVTVTSVTAEDDQIEIINAQQSCQGRCGGNTTGTWTTIIPSTSPDACHCSFDCADNSTCCPDFAEYCILATTDDPNNSSDSKDEFSIQYNNVSTSVEPKDELEPYTTKSTKSISSVTNKITIHHETPFATTRTSSLAPTTETHLVMEHVMEHVQSVATLSLSELLSIIIGVVVLGTIVIVIVFIMRRRKSYVSGRKCSKGSGLSEDSDVRFLTSDEILDFNLARPVESDEP